MQRRQEKELDKLIQSSLNNEIFSGCSYCFSLWAATHYQRFCSHQGLAQRIPIERLLSEESIFDLASLTKPLATVPVLLSLFDKEKLSLTTSLGEFFADCPRDKEGITIAQLMSHSAGFPAHREYFQDLLIHPQKEREEVLLQYLLKEGLEYSPGSGHCYSDLGYMLLGLLIKRATGHDIAALAESAIYTPLGLEKELFFPGSGRLKEDRFVSTETCPWTDRMLSGTVHDDNCRALGGIAGHAGLFGTIHGVTSLCEFLLDQWQDRRQHPPYSNHLLQQAVAHQEGERWTIGFDTPSKEGSSSGHYFSQGSVGHLGFTGTSFWIDPKRQAIVVLLTNRVHPSREDERIRRFRPVFHDILMRKG